MQVTPTDELDAWAASGAMWLTGHAPGEPLGPPAQAVTRLNDHADRIRRTSRSIGRAVTVSPLGLLTERAALQGLSRQGRTSCGGATRLLPAADGWLALALARPDDVELLPAWLGTTSAGPGVWDEVAAAVARGEVRQLVCSGAELGLPVAALGECTDTVPVSATPYGARPATTSLENVLVVDLSALWAGPLCGSLLADAGADVVKVETRQRPDDERAGNATFFDLLNAGKRSVALDLRTSNGRRSLRALIGAADVVIEASRPRALEQMGIIATDLLSDPNSNIGVWLSITAHGRSGAGRHRVGFGDDAAVAGGMVAAAHDGPVFCADAVADPVTGIVAAEAVLEALQSPGAWLLDLAMSRVATSMAGATVQGKPGDDVAIALPVPTRDRGRAAPAGHHTREVLVAIERP